MKKIMFLLALVILLSVSIVPYFKLYALTDTDEEIETSNITVASALSDNDQPCYMGGKYVGNCSRSRPYFNVFSGECYATLEDCKEADGDLQDNQGSGGCVRCGK